MKHLLVLILFVFMAAPSFAVSTPTSTIVINNSPNEFKKIDAGELPPAVVQALLKDYPTSRLYQAFKNQRGKYKLIMVLKSGTRRTVYIDSYGRWTTK